ncbi:sigma 54-interacting transcriptional regulator [Effusibacillus pohliae]|uniref:sigma 54-interacting transcriptional regulator n=1 Tax=Effusibacillus pohliae TaxID=232270 RepID=UPI0003612DEA|nr:sigma-54-dependent Fis family transcriptional regulator [Effusibacillus pohliae]
MKRVLLIGAGKGGSSILRVLTERGQVQVVGVIDLDDQAPGIQLARQLGIPTGRTFEPFLTEALDLVIEATGSGEAYQKILERLPAHVILIPGDIAQLLMSLIEEKERLIRRLTQQRHELDVILNSTHDGMIAVDQNGIITLFNAAAERIMGIRSEDAIGYPAQEVIPNTRLHLVLQSGQQELNQLQWLEDTRIITNRVPVTDDAGKLIGAVAVFRDVTEVQELVEEVTNLKEIQSLLSAIIHSTQDAISVVDEKGHGLLINPAYTRLTGLTEKDVLGKPATVDIAEGESMHMHVLQTGQPVRGVQMKVGPNRKEVLVNVAPVLVEGNLRGSVAVIQDISEIKKLSDELDEAKQLIRKLEAKYTFEDIIGTSPEMQMAIEQAKIAAQTPATVLLRGESGTGKELFAHAIHSASVRRYNQFIRVNCAAISETLLESELFGYVEGAFTGAARGGKKGLFEEASGGTIFLDEIGELSVSTQAKILRVLQEKEILRVGSSKPIAVDVRVIAATHVDLEQAIRSGRFREDLYYRLNVLPIVIPPLRERKTDLLPLCHKLIRKFNQEYGRNVERISDAAFAKMLAYDWPGNVRELENVLGRAIINMKFTETVIEAEHLPELQQSRQPQEAKKSGAEADRTLQTLEQAVAETERNLILRALEASAGNKTKAAQMLGVSVRHLYNKLEKYGIQQTDRI